jgi:hypothetical protein
MRQQKSNKKLKNNVNDNIEKKNRIIKDFNPG